MRKFVRLPKSQRRYDVPPVEDLRPGAKRSLLQERRGGWSSDMGFVHQRRDPRVGNWNLNTRRQES